MVVLEMIVLPGHKLVYVSVPKAGTHTMFRILQAIGGVKQDGPFHRKAVPLECRGEGWRTFTVVRDPYTRVASAWHHLTKRAYYPEIWLPHIGGPGFDTFLDYLLTGNLLGARGNAVAIPQHEWLAEVDTWKALHLEDVGEQLREIGIDVPDVPNAFHAKYKHPDLTPERIDKINQWAGKDFVQYGYPRRLR